MESPSTRRSEPELSVGTLAIRDSDRRFIQTVNWMDFWVGDATYNILPPTDIYLFAVRFEDGVFAPVQSRFSISACVFSIRDRAMAIELTGRRSAVAATLTPEGLFKLFGALDSSRLDRPLPIEALVGDASARRLSEGLHGAVDWAERTNLFGRWLEERLERARGLDAPLARVARAASVWSAEPAENDIARVAATLGVGVRQLERDFDRAIRVSPGTYRRIVKFQRAAAHVFQGGRLLDAAVDHGFADQAHMTNVFRRYAALTPRALAREGSKPRREEIRRGLAGRVVLLDLPPALDGAPAPQDFYGDRSPESER